MLFIAHCWRRHSVLHVSSQDNGVEPTSTRASACKGAPTHTCDTRVAVRDSTVARMSIALQFMHHTLSTIFCENSPYGNRAVHTVWSAPSLACQL